jgi:hypothetical protein
MRVMCVIAFTEPASLNKPRPEVGDEDIVTEVVEVFCLEYYELERFGDLLYKAEHFAVLPDAPAEVVEETEFETA